MGWSGEVEKWGSGEVILIVGEALPRPCVIYLYLPLAF